MTRFLVPAGRLRRLPYTQPVSRLAVETRSGGAVLIQVNRISVYMGR
ncbi:hypothetical protein [Pseudoxanthomonas sacheonensis]|nr:hypothetical protein [Pseudoxanthomonas sacheonensis]